MTKLETRAQTTNTVLMVRPDHFGYNPQTQDNSFQHPQLKGAARLDRIVAGRQFDAMAQNLTSHGVTVVTLDSPKTPTPDAVYPNNWVSTHEDGKLIFYPMAAANRRIERQQDVLQRRLSEAGLVYPTVIDLTGHENQDKILEGTGSLVLDRINKVAYAIESRRTNRDLFTEWTKMMDYKGVFFKAADKVNPPYHTNVIMSVGTEFAVVAPSLIAKQDAARVVGNLKDSGRDVIEITPDQVGSFCGNILDLASKTSDRNKITMSTAAYRKFTPDQRAQLRTYGDLVHSSISRIEQVGGGSARCMLGEIFVPKPVAVYNS